RATPSEVKRDMEIARDEVRVMTVHGAKGLEAPIVILADTTTEPAGPPRPRLLKITADGSPGAPVRMVWPGPGSKESYATAVRRGRRARGRNLTPPRVLCGDDGGVRPPHRVRCDRAAEAAGWMLV